MKAKHTVVLTIILFMGITGIQSQSNNLILNPSFEEKPDTCPMDGGFYAYGFVTNWTTAGPAVGTYFHVCGNGYSPFDRGYSIPANRLGHQIPHSGYAYVGS